MLPHVGSQIDHSGRVLVHDRLEHIRAINILPINILCKFTPLQNFVIRCRWKPTLTFVKINIEFPDRFCVKFCVRLAAKLLPRRKTNPFSFIEYF